VRRNRDPCVLRIGAACSHTVMHPRPHDENVHISPHIDVGKRPLSHGAEIIPFFVSRYPIPDPAESTVQHILLRPTFCLLLPLLFAACTDRASVATQDPVINEHLDRGNAGFAMGDAAAALEAYRDALIDDPQNAAAWYGVYMSSAALGDSATAAEALEHVERLAPGVELHAHPHLRSDTPQRPHP
jgi:hypothetical protein